MPIKPENRSRYPKDWKQIRARILKRADDACECHGECGEHVGEHCGIPNGAWICRHLEEPWRYITADDVENGATAVDDRWADRAHRVVLTIMHLDHTPEHNADENLLAGCQRCHLLYDKDERAATARRTRRAAKAAGELF